VFASRNEGVYSWFVRKVGIFLIEIVGVGIVLGWLMATYPEVFDAVIPWIALIILWRLTWLVLDNERIKTVVLGAKKRKGNMIWVAAFVVGGLISTLYLFSIRAGLQELADIHGRKTVTSGSVTSKTSPGNFQESKNYFVTIADNRASLIAKDELQNVLHIDKDDVLRARVRDGKILVTAKLFAGANSQPVEIVDNTIQLKQGTWDRNLDDTAFEVVNQDQEPVLQIIYTTPYNVTVYGVFGYETGQVIAWLSPGGILLKPKMPVTDSRYKLKRIFKYPSRKYFGQEEIGADRKGNAHLR